MAKYLFLDIDGVLNTHDFNYQAKCGPIHSDKVFLLNKVLQWTGAMIVVSSSWRYIVHRGEASLEGFDWMLRSHGVMHSRLAGVTRKDTLAMRMNPWNGNPETWPIENERGQEIADYLMEHPAEKYAVVDDLDLGISGRHPFVQTDGTVGLTGAKALDLIRLLR